MEDILGQIQNGVLKGDTKYVIDRTELSLRYGISIEEIMRDALFPPMQLLGEQLRKNEIFIPDVLKASRAMHAALYVLRPIISHCGNEMKGLVVIGTVAGDLHDIGKNMVVMMLMGHGYTVIDLGIDVTKERFAEAVVNYKPNVLALSALLTTTILEIQNVIEYLKERGLRDQVKITIGGAPTTMDFARECGADAYSDTVFDALEAVDDLIAGKVGRYAAVR
ncbi:MAG: cobalamin-binding protein [Lachnospiraceae bacterium]|jgi:5-methyltetrahydrofolate--homocysteine methyltransferase|nr:cobalamin-binding protein [Lachnospiraceae bacterium]